jgi:dienelactone hydrolase
LGAGHTDKPLLVLMGELDNETPPAECIPRLDALKARGAPVESHLYPGTTHCWDCFTLNNFRKTDFQGNSIIYSYNKTVTDDSANRAIIFFEKHLAAKK